MSEQAPKTPQMQRRAVIRTALLLAAFAVASYALFLWNAVHSK